MGIHPGPNNGAPECPQYVQQQCSRKPPSAAPTAWASRTALNSPRVGGLPAAARADFQAGLRSAISQATSQHAWTCQCLERALERAVRLTTKPKRQCVSIEVPFRRSSEMSPETVLRVTIEGNYCLKREGNHKLRSLNRAFSTPQN